MKKFVLVEILFFKFHKHVNIDRMTKEICIAVIVIGSHAVT